MTTMQILIIAACCAAGATVHGCLGIGLALVAGPALIAIDPAFAPGPLLIAGQVVGVRHLIMERGHIDREALRRCFLGLPFGLAGGLLLLSLVSDRTLSILIGAFTAIAAIALLAGASIRRSPRTDVAGGGAVAFSSITAGLPGPPWVVAFSDMPPQTMRGTSATYLIAVAITGLVGLILTGEFGRHEAVLTAWTLPGIAIGLVLARLLRPRLDPAVFRPIVLVVALVGAVALILRQVT